MDTDRFDAVARLFAARRSRRAAIGLGTAAVAAGLVPATYRIRAQEATPDPGATPGVRTGPGVEPAEKQTYLFVQSFRSGALTPGAAPGDDYTLTLSEGLGQTIYFSDRPDRVVGAVSTPSFLDSLGFTPENPPNAALVADIDGNEDIVVVELLDPRYDEASHTATYTVRILADAERVDLAFRQAPAGEEHAGATYGASHLFIDDCANAPLDCVLYDPTLRKDESVGQIQVAPCYRESSPGVGSCGTCDADPNSYAEACAGAFPDICYYREAEGGGGYYWNCWGGFLS